MSHDACITRWLAQSNTCPSCRHQLPADGTPKDDLIPKLQVRVGRARAHARARIGARMRTWARSTRSHAHALTPQVRARAHTAAFQRMCAQAQPTHAHKSRPGPLNRL
eukprot:3008882-Pleurochrysis_carterae.AAC.1